MQTSSVQPPVESASSLGCSCAWYFMCMIHVYPSCFPAFKGRLNSWKENLPGAARSHTWSHQSTQVNCKRVVTKWEL